MFSHVGWTVPENAKPTFLCKGHLVSRTIAGLWHPLTFKNNQFTIQTKTQNVSYFTHVMPNSSHFTSKSLLGILEKQATASEHYHISLKTPLQRNVYMKTSHLRPATGVDFVEHDELSILVRRSNSESNGQRPARLFQTIGSAVEHFLESSWAFCKENTDSRQTLSIMLTPHRLLKPNNRTITCLCCVLTWTLSEHETTLLCRSDLSRCPA